MRSSTQFEVFDRGYRHTAFITDQAGADIAALELRHRRRSRVEDAIRCARDTGIRNLPFAAFAHQVWLLAQELLCRGCSLCLAGKLALAEPKRLGQRLLHVAGRIVHSAPPHHVTAARHPALGQHGRGGLRAAAGVAGGLGRRHQRPVLLVDPLDQQLAAVRAGASVSVDPHPVSSLLGGWLDIPSLQGGPDGQRCEELQLAGWGCVALDTKKTNGPATSRAGR
jgi:hypothetical protein